MTRKKKAAAKSPAFASRPAAAGSAVSFTIHDQEHTLEVAEGPDGWAITPNDEEEAAALAQISDEALNPPPAEADASAAEDSVQPPDDADGADGDQEDQGSDENAGEPGQEDQA